MSFWEILKEDFSQPKLQDPAFYSNLEIFFNYPGVWAVIMHRFSHALYERNFIRLSRIFSGINRFFTGVDIHPAAKVGRRVFFDHATGIVIGQTAIIGDECLIYQGVTLGGVSLDKGKRHPTLGKGVVVGAGAKILGNITIGDGSKIGSNSVVVKDVPPGCTAVGIPAKILHKECGKQLDHDKIPDITKEIFIYLMARIENLEKAALKQENGLDVIKNDENLAKIYEEYLKSIKD